MHDPAFREWWSTYLRMGASPWAALALTQMNADIDVRHLLPAIRVPTLIIHRTDDRCLAIEEGRYVAAQIPGARLLELPGDDHLPFVGDQNAMLTAIEHFLEGRRDTAEANRVLATVVTATVARRPARPDLRPAFESHVRKEVEWYRGRLLELSEATVQAAFDGRPAPSVAPWRSQRPGRVSPARSVLACTPGNARSRGRGCVGRRSTCRPT